MTFSIVARSDDGESWGVAVASKFLGVGSAVPAAVAGIGAIATQAYANVAYKGEGLALLDEGANAEVAVQRLIEDDPGRSQRQVGIVDLDGGSASYTGEDCMDWAGGRTGHNYAIQGNILTGPEVVESMERAFTEATGDLGARLHAALLAGDRAGGDSRGRQSAAILVVKENAGYGGFDDVLIDLRVDDHPDPVVELGRLLDLHDLYGVATEEGARVRIDDALRSELDDRARARGARDFMAWVGTENYEMRVAEDGTWIDERILAIIREDQA
jgi:uncharacterized Ntn-hydrolase superfamily protein